MADFSDKMKDVYKRQDLTKAADYIRSRTFSPFTSYIVSALLYLVVISIFTKLVGKLERRLRRSDNR